MTRCLLSPSIRPSSRGALSFLTDLSSGCILTHFISSTFALLVGAYFNCLYSPFVWPPSFFLLFPSFFFTGRNKNDLGNFSFLITPTPCGGSALVEQEKETRKQDGLSWYVCPSFFTGEGGKNKLLKKRGKREEGGAEEIESVIL